MRSKSCGTCTATLTPDRELMMGSIPSSREEPDLLKTTLKVAGEENIPRLQTFPEENPVSFIGLLLFVYFTIVNIAKKKNKLLLE